ncbi:MAG: LamG-like jellyroll fold domain-containing protein [Bacteroidota bacterium]
MAFSAGIAPALAQTPQDLAAWSAEALPAAQRTNLFASWNGVREIDGVVLRLPDGWRLNEAIAIERPFMKTEELRVRRLRTGTYRLDADRELTGAYQLVLDVTPARRTETARWEIAPFVRRGSAAIELTEHRSNRTLQLVRPKAPAGNRALQLAATDPPLELEPAVLPRFGNRNPFTVEFWTRTIDRGGVLFSTWDGQESTAYPFEFMVDKDGHLSVYRGGPGRHQSVVSRVPIADGVWHHVAITYRPARLELVINGELVDAVDAAELPSLNERAPVVLGSRPNAPRTRRIEAELDELRFWSEARTVESIRRTRSLAMQTQGGDRIVIDFEGVIPRGLLTEPAGQVGTAPATLMLQYPVQQIAAEVQAEGVWLSWETEVERDHAFVVERSEDGERFEEIYREPAYASSAAQRFSFVDYDAQGESGVRFYRVVQRFEDGIRLTSKTLKVGLGPAELPRTARLLGNWPNPFTSRTDIRFELTESQTIGLSVWDVSGHQVGQLANGRFEPGPHQITFDASRLPSGTYFVHLQTAAGEQTLKMLLAR